MKKVLIYSDTHIPYQDNKLLDLIYKFGKHFKPDIVVHAGDLLDCYPISSFTKDPLDTHTLMDEIKIARKHLTKFRKLAKRFIYVEGNHEARNQKYIASNAKELAGLTKNGERVLTLPYLLGLNELGIEWIDMVGRESFVKLNRLYIGHFNVARKHSCYTAKALVDDKGVSVVQSHSHRMGMFFKTNYDRELVGIETGCTCDLNPEYVSNPNWQHGITVAYLDDNEKRFQAYPIRIVDYEFMFGNKKFSSP